MPLDKSNGEKKAKTARVNFFGTLETNQNLASIWEVPIQEK